MTTTDERVLILMPTARDGERMTRALAAAGLACTVCKDFAALCQEVGQGGGAALLTEEAIEADVDRRLPDVLQGQPPWSDFPLVVLAREEGHGHQIRESMNATLVERPVRVRSLRSVVRAALRSRRRQYEVRDHLAELKRAEGDRAQLAAIVESSTDAIVSKSLDGTILTWNAGAERLFGYTAEEAVGRPITLIIPPDRVAEERTILARLGRGEAVEHFETVRVTKAAHRLDISLTISPIRDRAGRVVAASKVARDITDKKRAEEALRESEERYRRAAGEAARAAEANAKFRTLFEQGTQFAGILTVDGTVIEANRLCLDACGFTREETLGRPFWECGWWRPSPALAETVRAACARAAAGETVRTESAYFVADGSERVVDLIIAPVTDEAGRVLFLNPTGTDVTEKKRAEAELRTQTERMRLLWEAAAVLLTTAEPDAMMRGLFSKIAAHFGLDTYFNFMVTEAGDALRLESCVGVPEETARAIQRLEFGQAVCGTVAQSRRPLTATAIQQSDDPRVQLVKGFGLRAYACNPLLAGDRLLGTLSFASRTRDTFDPDEQEFLRTVCHYVTVAYERLRLVGELRASDRKKDDFIALLAHELRNPLAPIRTGLQVLRLSGDDARTGDRARDMMDRQLTHMVRLIDDLLDVSRIGRHKMELRRERVSLEEVLKSAVETAQPALDAAGHELTVSLPADPVYLDADLTRLAQVFSNLLTNSAKYTPRGGRVRLTAEPRGGTVAVAVRDTGIGIPAAALPTIFDMFSQVDRSIERATGGLGIGLALVKGLTEMHDGTVTAESTGQGSTFTVTLPVVGTRPDPRPEVSAGAAKGGSAQRILVVDDNRDGAESLSLMLEMLGNEVRTAHDGVEAVERAREFRPGVILMDVGMPRLNGYEATRRIRAQAWGEGITIIALTGWGQDGDRKLSREAGCDGHLVKPVSLPDLERMLGERTTAGVT